MLWKIAKTAITAVGGRVARKVSTNNSLAGTAIPSVLSAHSRSMSRHLIIDTDGGFDDLIAVHALLDSRQSQGEKAPLISTVGGVLPAPTGAALLRGLFPHATITTGRNAPTMPFDPIPEWLMNYRSSTLSKFSEAMSIQPVPVLPDNAQDEHDHQHESLEHFLECIQTSPENGVDLICLGPLSNLAHWLDHLENENKSLLASKINHVFILGGNYPHSNAFTKENAEFNFSLDPKAVDRVFRSPLLKDKLNIIPTTVSDRVRLKSELGETLVEEFIQQSLIMSDGETPSSFVGKVLQFDSVGYSLSCDPICAFAAEHIHKCKWERIAVGVDTTSGLLLPHTEEEEEETFVRIATNIDLSEYLLWIGRLYT